MTTTPKTPKGPIDFARITDAQRMQMQRVLQTGARIGAQQDKAHRAILQAMRDTLDPMLDSIVDERMLEALFRAWTDAASLANARKIARHPLCPPSIVEAVAQRAEKPANDATPPNQKPGPQSSVNEG